MSLFDWTPAFAGVTKKKKRLWLTVTAGSAVLMGVLAWLFLRHLEISAQEAGEAVPVLVASRYIPRGAALRPALFQAVAVPKAYAEPGAVQSFEVLESSPGRPRFRSLLPIPQGARLAQRELGFLDKSDSLSQVIPERLAAVSFGVDDTRGLGGNLQPGDLIDVLRTPKGRDMDPAPRPTLLLFQAVPVIAVGKKWTPLGASDVPQDKSPGEPPREQEETTVLSVLLNPLAAVRLAEEIIGLKR